MKVHIYHTRMDISSQLISHLKKGVTNTLTPQDSLSPQFRSTTAAVRPRLCISRMHPVCRLERWDANMTLSLHMCILPKDVSLNYVVFLYFLPEEQESPEASNAARTPLGFAALRAEDSPCLVKLTG